MSDDRFGMPGHAPQHDLPIQSTTPQGSWSNIGDGGDWAAPQSRRSNYVGGGWTNGINLPLDPIKKIRTSVCFALLLGPLGLFYVGLLHGVIALFTVIPIARGIGIPLAAALNVDPVYMVIVTIWCITVPWAIYGTIARNRRFRK